MIRNDVERYGAVALFLHWLVVALIVVQFVLANLAELAEERGGAAGLMQQLALLARHKSFGITILVLVVLRFLWRWISPPPALPPTMSSMEKAAAKAVHWGLYATLLFMPITGWLTSSAANFPVSYFGLFTLPDMVSPDDALKDIFEESHHAAATVLIVLVCVHVLAAAKHHLWDRDNVLLRMLPFVRLREERP
jgi:cytochrome b561